MKLPKEWQRPQCAKCGILVDAPAVYVRCGHAFHERCWRAQGEKCSCWAGEDAQAAQAVVGGFGPAGTARNAAGAAAAGAGAPGAAGGAGNSGGTAGTLEIDADAFQTFADLMNGLSCGRFK